MKEPRFTFLLWLLLFVACGCNSKPKTTPPSGRYNADSLMALASTDLDAAYQRIGEGERSGELSAHEAALMNANITYLFTENYTLAKDYCQNAIDALGENDDERRLAALHLLGTIAETVKDFNTCIKACSEGKVIANRNKQPLEEYKFDYIAGKCMFDLDLHDEGIALMQSSIDKAKPLAKTESDFGNLVYFVNNLINCYLAVGNMQKALEASETLEDLLGNMETKYPDDKPYCDSYRYHLYAERAVAKVSLGQTDAQADFDRALAYDFAHSADGCMLQADYYAATGQVDSVASLLARYPYQGTDTVQRLYRRRLSRIEQAYRVAGDTAMASLYQHRLDTLSQLIERREQQERTAVNAAQYETQVHKLALDNLTKTAKKTQVLLGFLALAVLLAILALYWGSKRKVAKAAKEMQLKSQSMEEEMTKLQKQVRLIAKDKAQGPAETRKGKSLTALVEGQKLYLNKDISRALIAEMMGCSHQTMTKMLNDIQPGLSFPDYIKGLRIAHALDLIKEHPDLTVQQIADQSGFYSISSFERSFKSITGKTPREYLRSL